MMSKTVSDQLALMEIGKIPLNTMKSEHIYPGDIYLKSFSVCVFLAMGGKMNPYRYKEIFFLKEEETGCSDRRLGTSSFTATDCRSKITKRKLSKTLSTISKSTFRRDSLSTTRQIMLL